MQKFIVDIAGSLPTIIAEYSDPNSFTNSYIYADAQILVQYAHSGDPNVADDKYYYVHDRLGSVRMVVDCNTVAETVTARNTYTYSPFGNPYAGELSETVYNPFQFTGQWLDVEINQYYLRARMYDPTMMRLTTRDPVLGRTHEPLTLHKYLYCGNDGLNRVDLDGRWAIVIGGSVSASLNDGIGLVSKVTRSMGVAAGSLVRQGLIGQLINELGGHIQGSAGLATVVGMSNEDGEQFIGSMYWVSGGLSTNAGVSAMVVFGFSPNANKLADFAGSYMEAGVSQTEGGFGGGAGASVGLSISRGYGSDITLITVSVGAAATSGKTSTAMFGGYGYSWVAEW